MDERHGNNQLFVTRSIRRFPNAWNLDPWQFSYASLGSQLILTKRIAPPKPAPFTPAPIRDEEAEAVKAVRENHEISSGTKYIHTYIYI